MFIKINNIFNTNNESEPGFDDLDDVAVALTNFVRELSDKPLTGILVVSDSADSLTDDESEACETLFACARHYDWLTSIALKKFVASDSLPALLESVDITLLPEVSAEVIDKSKDKKRYGGGLTKDFWREVESQNINIGGLLLYGYVPEDTAPETVGTRIRSICP